MDFSVLAAIPSHLPNFDQPDNQRVLQINLEPDFRQSFLEVIPLRLRTSVVKNILKAFFGVR